MKISSSAELPGMPVKVKILTKIHNAYTKRASAKTTLQRKKTRVHPSRSRITTIPYDYTGFQSISPMPFRLRISLVFEKCLHPKKPLWAEKGEGCAAFNTKCFEVSMSDDFS